MKKPVFYTELAYIIGLFLLAWGTALTVWGGYGISMVVAPAYILHAALSQKWAWFSFGIAEYVLQAFVLGMMMLLLRRVKFTYFLSFASAVIYGLMLDGGTALFQAILPAEPQQWQLMLAYVGGDLAVCAGVALMFATYLPPEAYEMFVKEIGSRLGVQLHLFKTIYDCTSLVIAIIMSFALLGGLENIGIGTVVCAFMNGIFIKFFSMLLEKGFRFDDLLPLRKKFEDVKESEVAYE